LKKRWQIRILRAIPIVLFSLGLIMNVAQAFTSTYTPCAKYDPGGGCLPFKIHWG